MECAQWPGGAHGRNVWGGLRHGAARTFASRRLEGRWPVTAKGRQCNQAMAAGGHQRRGKDGAKTGACKPPRHGQMSVGARAGRFEAWEGTVL